MIARAAELLRQSRCAVALTGAGISTPSGIPDFRSPYSGVWDRVDPMAVASISAFQRQPADFFDWIRPLARLMRDAQPNPAHEALARLEGAGFLRSVITQNIDGLHQRSGSRRVHELHGHMRQATCVRCHQVQPAQGLIQDFIDDGQIPRCSCGGVMKPDVILYGEQLSNQVLTAARQDAGECDLMLVAGSSLEIQPAASLPLEALNQGSRLIIVNYESTSLDPLADLCIHQNVAEVLPRVADLAIDLREGQQPHLKTHY